jgi:hypothetical protein
MAFFEKNMFKSDISLGGLRNNNEIKKSFKPEEIKKVKFDVIVRIRQAYSKKELINEEIVKKIITKIYQPFDLFQ